MDNQGSNLGAFIPLVSAALGAGATLLWQALGNARTEAAVRVQTNARLFELITYLASAYESQSLSPDETQALARLVTSLDDMQIALAYRNDAEVLWLLGQTRVQCEALIAFNKRREFKSIGAATSSKAEQTKELVRESAAAAMWMALKAFRHDEMRRLAERTAAAYGFSEDERKRFKETHSLPKIQPG